MLCLCQLRITRFLLCAIAIAVTLGRYESAVGQESVDGEEATLRTPRDDDGRVVVFARDVAPILQIRCLECHGPEDAKNDFRVDDREMVLDYLEPEDAESSTLYADYLTIDDDDMLMPPRSHGGPLLAPELALIRVWIEEGADWPEDVSLVAEDESVAVEAVAAVPPRALVDRVWAAQGFLHPATVHFPIAFLLLGAGFVILGWKWPVLGTQIPFTCLLLGSASAVVATVMGWSFATEQGYGAWDRFDAAMMDREIFLHRWSGVIVSVLSVGLTLIAFLTLRGDRPKLTVIWKVGLLVCAALVGAVGHQGGEMSYGQDFYPKAWRILTGTDDLPPAVIQSESIPPE